MDDNEKLIEEAVSAMYEATFGYAPSAMEPDTNADWESLARAALAVFEKEQVEPSDAQVHAALCEYNGMWIDHPWSPAAMERMRRTLRAAGGVR